MKFDVNTWSCLLSTFVLCIASRATLRSSRRRQLTHIKLCCLRPNPCLAAGFCGIMPARLLASLNCSSMRMPRHWRSFHGSCATMLALMQQMCSISSGKSISKSQEQASTLGWTSTQVPSLMLGSRSAPSGLCMTHCFVMPLCVPDLCSFGTKCCLFVQVGL